MHDLPRSPPRRRPDRRRRNAAGGGPAQAQTTVKIIANDDNQSSGSIPRAALPGPQRPGRARQRGALLLPERREPAQRALHRQAAGHVPDHHRIERAHVADSPAAVTPAAPSAPASAATAAARGHHRGRDFGSRRPDPGRHHDPRLGEGHARRVAAAGARVRAPQGAVGRAQQQAGSVGRQSRSGGRRRAGRVRSQANSAARRTLRRNGRLAISLRLTVTPPLGNAYKVTRTLVLRPAR